MKVLGADIVLQRPLELEDVASVFNHHYTAILLCLLGMFVHMRDYIMQPIQCWVPAEMTSGWEQYIENYCWVQNTYYVPLNESIPPTDEDRRELQLSYYQWTSLILYLTALSFYVPHLCWTLLSGLSGVSVAALNSLASNAKIVVTDGKFDESTNHLGLFLVLQLHQLRRPAYVRARCALLSRLRTSYLTLLFLVVKAAYVLLAIGYVFVLNRVLGTSDVLYGWTILRNVVRGVDWQRSGFFPRVTLCDIPKREVGNLQTHTVECVLVANMFNEKIFALLWFWLLALCLANAASLLGWLQATVRTDSRLRFVCGLVNLVPRSKHRPDPNQLFQERAQHKSFVNGYLHLDGVLLLRLIEARYGCVLASAAARVLWYEFAHGRPTPPTSPRARLRTHSTGSNASRRPFYPDDAADDDVPASPTAKCVSYAFQESALSFLGGRPPSRPQPTAPPRPSKSCMQPPRSPTKSEGFQEMLPNYLS